MLAVGGALLAQLVRSLPALKASRALSSAAKSASSCSSKARAAGSALILAAGSALILAAGSALILGCLKSTSTSLSIASLTAGKHKGAPLPPHLHDEGGDQRRSCVSFSSSVSFITHLHDEGGDQRRKLVKVQPPVRRLATHPVGHGGSKPEGT